MGKRKRKRADRKVYGFVMAPGDEIQPGEFLSQEGFDYAVAALKDEAKRQEEKAAKIIHSEIRNGAWFVTAQVDDDRLWEQIQSKRITSFSISGKAIRVLRWWQRLWAWVRALWYRVFRR